MKYYIIAGEASGDLHGSNLIKELQKLDASANIRCWGGDLMQATGATLVKHYKDLAFMGFVEVLLNLTTILKNLKFCKADIAQFQPDVLVLVDYPGFNLPIALHDNNTSIKIYPTDKWKSSTVNKRQAALFTKEGIEKMYYLNVKEMNNPAQQ